MILLLFLSCFWTPEGKKNFFGYVRGTAQDRKGEKNWEKGESSRERRKQKTTKQQGRGQNQTGSPTATPPGSMVLLVKS
jgi:hypothetical protein